MAFHHLAAQHLYRAHLEEVPAASALKASGNGLSAPSAVAAVCPMSMPIGVAMEKPNMHSAA